MYFFTSFDFASLLISAVQIAAFSAGGYLLTAAFSTLEPRDRLFPGVTLGLVLFIVISNITAQILPLNAAFPAACILILLAGSAAAFLKRAEIDWSHKVSFEAVQIGMLLGLVMLFTMINRGLAILDDYHNLPIVSIMATGKIPPPFYLKNDTPMAYHYGLHIFSTFLASEGGFFPWSAYDISKSLVLSLTILSAWVWFRKKQLSTSGLLMSVFIFALAGGTRWLLLFAPAGWLQSTSSGLELLGERVTSNIWLTESISTAWEIEGAGPFPFPFAFANGIFHPIVFSLGSNSTLPLLTIIMLLLIRPARWSLPTIILASFSIASLGLSAELYAGLIYVGAAVAFPIALIKRKDRAAWLPWAAVLGTALPLLLVQGGVLSSVFRTMVLQAAGSAAPDTGFGGFSFTPIPTVISAHLGRLPLTNPDTAVLAVLEIGPVLLLIPFTIMALKKYWANHQLLPVIILLGSFLIPFASLFFHYSVERDTSRLIGNSCFLWLLLGLPVLFQTDRRSKFRTGIKILLSVSMLGGVVFLAVMLTAVKSPVQSYFLTGVDAQFHARYWDRLEEDAWVFDPYPHRAVTVFGRISDTNESLRVYLDSFRDLLADPLPENASAAGFDYYYLDETSWQYMNRREQESFEAECVQSLTAIEDNIGNLRILYDISACR